MTNILRAPGSAARQASAGATVRSHPYRAAAGVAPVATSRRVQWPGWLGRIRNRWRSWRDGPWLTYGTLDDIDRSLMILDLHVVLLDSHREELSARLALVDLFQDDFRRAAERGGAT